jgi:hypothetical protein
MEYENESKSVMLSAQHHHRSAHLHHPVQECSGRFYAAASSISQCFLLAITTSSNTFLVYFSFAMVRPSNAPSSRLSAGVHPWQGFFRGFDALRLPIQERPGFNSARSTRRSEGCLLVVGGFIADALSNNAWWLGWTISRALDGYSSTKQLRCPKSSGAQRDDLAIYNTNDFTIFSREESRLTLVFLSSLPMRTKYSNDLRGVDGIEVDIKNIWKLGKSLGDLTPLSSPRRLGEMRPS